MLISSDTVKLKRVLKFWWGGLSISLLLLSQILLRTMETPFITVQQSWQFGRNCIKIKSWPCSSLGCMNRTKLFWNLLCHVDGRLLCCWALEFNTVTFKFVIAAFSLLLCRKRKKHMTSTVSGWLGLWLGLCLSWGTKEHFSPLRSHCMYPYWLCMEEHALSCGSVRL